MKRNSTNSRVPEGWDPELWLAIAPEVRGKVEEMLRTMGGRRSGSGKGLLDDDVQGAEGQGAGGQFGNGIPGEGGSRDPRDGETRELRAPRSSHGVPYGAGSGAASGRDGVPGIPGGSRDPRAAHGENSRESREQAAFRALPPALQELARRDPQAFERLRAAAVQRDAARQEELRRQELKASMEAVLPKIQALVGDGFERGAFREEVGRYLLEQGVPMQALTCMCHGWELELATKAMLFDKAARRRAEAEAKLEGLPDVQSPRRAGVSDADRLSRARAGLNRNPNSTAALAELFAAM